jgi:two-component system NtrC family sensor kinase
MAGLTPAFHETFGLCWIADGMGLILLAPPALALRAPRLTPRQELEAVAWLVAGVSFVYVVYVGTLSGPVALAASYAVFPLVLAVALRFGVAITGIIVVAIAGVALACTGLGKGPFAQGSLTANLLSLHSHLAMLGLTGLILASARSERDAAEARAREHLGTLARAGRLDAVSSMAAGIAHEINQPLSAVNSYAQAACRMLREGRGADEISEAMERIVAGNERAADIVRRIRGFLGSGTGERQVADLNQLSRDGIELVVPEYHRQHVGLSSTRSPHPLHVEVDPIAIRQVVVNLLQNALEALHDASTANPHVRVTTRVSEGGDWAELVVEDNGPGLPEEGRNELFEPMVTHRAEGTGLGLAIVRSLITAHEGTIEAGDAEQGGARFVVRLPSHANLREAA